MSMPAIKIQQCRQHWEALPVTGKCHATAKHLIAAVEIAEQLFIENNKLEMECREHRAKEAGL